MDLIHFVVKDGVLNAAESCVASVEKEELEGDRGTVYSAMRQLQRQLELSQVTMGTIASKRK